jgi:hypothetical protein
LAGGGRGYSKIIQRKLTVASGIISLI